MRGMSKLKLYRVMHSGNVVCGMYNGFVVCARSPKHAHKIISDEKMGCDFAFGDTTHIGYATSRTKPGIILDSFNAG